MAAHTAWIEPSQAGCLAAPGGGGPWIRFGCEGLSGTAGARKAHQGSPPARF
jgi:hypothetical protein